MLNHKDVSALLGINKTTTMWELWHINKGNIAREYNESSRSFWLNILRPHIINGLQKRYNCELEPIEKKTAHDIVSVTASKIILRGNLPSGNATHILVDMISSEGYTTTYSDIPDGTLPSDMVQASLAQNAFQTDNVVKFLLIGNGEREQFIEYGKNTETNNAVQNAINVYTSYITNDIEPEPDYYINSEQLSFMAARSPDQDHIKEIDPDSEFDNMLLKHNFLSEQKKLISKKDRDLKKDLDEIKGWLAHKLGNHNTARYGEKIISFSTVSRTTKASSTEYAKLTIK